MTHNGKGLAAVQDVCVPEAQPIFCTKLVLLWMNYNRKPVWQHS